MTRSFGASEPAPALPHIIRYYYDADTREMSAEIEAPMFGNDAARFTVNRTTLRSSAAMMKVLLDRGGLVDEAAIERLAKDDDPNGYEVVHGTGRVGWQDIGKFLWFDRPVEGSRGPVELKAPEVGDLLAAGEPTRRPGHVEPHRLDVGC